MTNKVRDINIDALELNKALVKLNIKRVTLAAFLVSLFEVFNFFDKSAVQYPFVRIGTIAVISVSLIYIVLGYFEERCADVNVVYLRTAYRAYWILLTLCMTPFFILDVRMGTLINVVLFFGLLVFAPVFSMKENKAMFSFFVLYVVVVVMLAKADFLSGLRTAFIGIGASLLSFKLHSGYMDMICSLHVEGAMDGLTKLCNKQEGLARMHALMTFSRRMQRTIALFYIDIDYFKSYNDTFGHVAGDQALAQVADCMRRCFSRETDILCRFGGEEFSAMICTDMRTSAIQMAKKLIRMVSDLGIQSGLAAKESVVTVSIGLVVLEPETGKSVPPEELIEEADRQLYIAKTGGRNCIAMNDGIVYRNDTE